MLNLLFGFAGFWVFTTISTYINLPKSYYYFVATELVIGIFAPLLIVIGTALVLLVLQHITNYKYRAETFIPGILSVIEFKRSEEYCFWVIAKYFYFPVDKDNIINEGQKLTWLQRKLNINVSSWCLTAILTLNLILCTTVIADTVINQRYESKMCDDNSINFDCFIHGSHIFINCSENISQVVDIECFRFVGLSEVYTTDPLNKFIQAVFLFLAAEKILSCLFNIVKSLMSFYCSEIWAIISIVIGCILSIVGIIAIAIYYVFHDNGYSFVTALQFTVLGLNITIGSVLLLIGSPMEVVGQQKEHMLQSLNTVNSTGSIHAQL